MSVASVLHLLLFLSLGEFITSSDINYWNPEQIHIAFGDDPSENLSVTWSTQNSTLQQPTVEYGEGELTNREVGLTRNFQDGGKEKRVQYIHRVILRNLKPATSYVYRCGSGVGWSKQYSFRTANNSVDWSPTLAIYGDMGITNARIMPVIQDAVNAKLYDAIIHVGDFAYNMDDDNGRVGDNYMRHLEPIAANVPYMACPGNHEEAYNFSNFRERFTMPGNSESLYYSFNMGAAHFISIDTEAYYFRQYGDSVLINQYNWLINELKEANKPENRQKRPWIILYGHKPMYCSNLFTDDCSSKRTKTRVGFLNDKWYQYGLEELLYNYGVDLVFWGHEHSYERTWPVYDYIIKKGSNENPYTNPGAPIHITTGAAGSKYYIALFNLFKPQWSALRSTDYGYTQLKVHNGTHLHVQQLSVKQGGKPVDDFWLIKTNHGPYGSSNENSI